jgi:hypothetical protein
MYALSPNEVLRSISASRDTLGKPPIRLIDVTNNAQSLIGGKPLAIIGGLAQILWARKTHRRLRSSCFWAKLYTRISARSRQ